MLEKLDRECTGLLSSLSGVQTSCAVRRYCVVGSSWQSLLTTIDVLGPRHDGTRLAALTSWHATWSHEVARTSSGFEVAHLKLGLDIHVTFPEWKPARSTNPSLVERWHNFTDYLAQHELMHIRNAVEGVRGMRPDVMAVRPQASEVALRMGVAMRIHCALERVRQRDEHLDRTTHHGRLSPNRALV